MAPDNTGDCFGCHTNGLTPSSAPSQRSGGHGGWQGMSAALLMASINSSGLPLPAHAHSLALRSPVSRSKTLSPSLQALPGARGPAETYAPSGFRLGTRGSGRVRGWPRSCLVLAQGGESAPVGGNPTGTGKNTWLRQDAVPECPGLHPLWVQNFPGRRGWISFSPAHTQRSLPRPYTLIPDPAYRARATKPHPKVYATHSHKSRCKRPR